MLQGYYIYSECRKKRERQRERYELGSTREV